MANTLNFTRQEILMRRKLESVTESWKSKIICDIEIWMDRETRCSHSKQRELYPFLLDTVILKEKKRIWRRYLEFVQEFKELPKMKVTVVAIINGSIGTDPKNLSKLQRELKIPERVRIIQRRTTLGEWMKNQCYLIPTSNSRLVLVRSHKESNNCMH